MILRCILLGTFLGLCALSLAIGVQSLSWETSALSQEAWFTLSVSRIPRLLALILIGAGLAICGVILQQLVRNKFVEPATSGGLDAAKLGILIAIVLFPGATNSVRMLFAFLCCFASSLVFIALVRRIPYQNSVLVPVIGLMYGAVLSAIAEFYAYQNNLLQNIQGWLLGDFSKVVQGNYEVLFIIVPVTMVGYAYAYRFTAMAMGRDMAESIGIRYQFTAAVGLILVALTVSAAVITVGAIPFIGLVIPNIVALFCGDNLRRTMPTIALSGASLLLICDVLSRTLLYPFEVPIGITAGVLGGVIFLGLILWRARS